MMIKKLRRRLEIIINKLNPRIYLKDSEKDQKSLCKQYHILNAENETKLPRYFVCYREVNDVGYGNQLFVLAHILEYAEKNKMIPLVHRQLLGCEKVNNQWETCFKQLAGESLERAYNSGSVYFNTSKRPPYGYWFDFWKLSDRKLNYYKKLFKKYICLNESMETYVSDFCKKQFTEKDCVLGVLARGTDYNETVAFGHPRQPSIDQILNKIRECLLEYRCNKIFVATEDSLILDAIKDKFGNAVVYIEQPRLKYEERKTINRQIRENNADKQLMMRSYVASLYILANTSYLIAGNTSGSMIIPLLGDNVFGRFRFELGVYDQGDMNSLLK